MISVSYFRLVRELPIRRDADLAPANRMALKLDLAEYEAVEGFVRWKLT